MVTPVASFLGLGARARLCTCLHVRTAPAGERHLLPLLSPWAQLDSFLSPLTPPCRSKSCSRIKAVTVSSSHTLFTTLNPQSNVYMWMCLCVKAHVHMDRHAYESQRTTLGLGLTQVRVQEDRKSVSTPHLLGYIHVCTIDPSFFT